MLLLFSLACGWRILKANQDEGEQGTLNREQGEIIVEKSFVSGSIVKWYEEDLPVVDALWAVRQRYALTFSTFDSL
ncbi:hypothetical protein SD80_028235 [Scytonema tolypothrichoides VB-61278]|nr:hypothetical protein SD80_028235 [Scytonema tolypothrichoides VB-61278]